MIDIQIKGGKELDAFLAQFPLKVQRQVLRNALRRGANVIRDEARLLAPKKTGKMAKSIKTDTRTENGLPVARVRLKGKGAYRGVFMEYGVAPHIISAEGNLSASAMNRRNKKREALKIGEVYVGKVQHPGVAPRPFMRPALDNKANEAINAVGQYIHQWMQVGSLQAPRIEVDEP